MSRLEIWAATTTPFDADGRLDVSVIPEQAEHLRRNGVFGAFVTGTTGEFASLSADERRQVVEAWAEARPDGLGLGAQVGSNDLAEAKTLAAHAEDHGVDLIASVAPYYGEAPRIELSVAHLRSVAAAAPRTPFCYYHIPSMTGSTLLPADVAASAAEEIPTFYAVKFTDEDLMEFDRTRRAHDGIKVFFGRDELLPAGLAFGTGAVIGSLFNGLAPVAHRVTEAYDRGEHHLAFTLHQPFRDIAEVSGRHGGLGFVKELMNRLSPDAGRPRLPWGPLDQSALAAIDDLLPSLKQAIADATEGEVSA
ncbi:dihydrodipicolinate synthase family protein [Solicola gregarius]|uniref:Dihydrodipicolinate synthase family protein n=1 Tax=Solicola gregarius TaxID=2908642 RepID=A0AA46TI48_9ACTN|nr:dihydrodipicolinate synthase family protein [Solicola gregarius]UYM05570.1 dihydrodipicolinate synthase family protein [Solicola gregarius]